MSRIATAIVAVSTAIMIAIILGGVVWIVASLGSYSPGKVLFVALFTAAFVIPAVWIGVRIGNRLGRQDRAYMERLRKKGKQ
jgi:hypothetical protein